MMMTSRDWLANLYNSRCKQRYKYSIEYKHKFAFRFRWMSGRTKVEVVQVENVDAAWSGHSELRLDLGDEALGVRASKGSPGEA